ncbi:MAG: hypothetical protein B9S32_00010 [Verrucomicrobia bacterium Tous-C9LFEB]|nr:MAG: hypothetical protein B9S32_00010 [Verrucomicrobia bacterium Tous-C9LFEB]
MSSPGNKLMEYYASTANAYDEAQVHPDDEHARALRFLSGFLSDYPAKSILDVGAGTGRGMLYLTRALPQLNVVGIEPSPELRSLAIQKGIPEEKILSGVGQRLPFADNSFDCVMCLGVLHHVENPRPVMDEMVRVAKGVIFISDHNIYGWGSPYTTRFKRLIRSVLGFNALKFLMTRGRGYHDTDYDGIFYPFSLLDHIEYLNQHCKRNHMVTTRGVSGRNYNLVSHLAYLGEVS